jgi:hypothetical protein
MRKAVLGISAAAFIATGFRPARKTSRLGSSAHLADQRPSSAMTCATRLSLRLIILAERWEGDPSPSFTKTISRNRKSDNKKQ